MKKGIFGVIIVPSSSISIIALLCASKYSHLMRWPRRERAAVCSGRTEHGTTTALRIEHHRKFVALGGAFWTHQQPRNICINNSNFVRPRVLLEPRDSGGYWWVPSRIMIKIVPSSSASSLQLYI